MSYVRDVTISRDGHIGGSKYAHSICRAIISVISVIIKF